MGDEEAVYFINKHDAKKRLGEMIRAASDTGVQYATEMIKEENKPNPNHEYIDWMRKQVEGLAEDIKDNVKMLWRADIETGHNLFYVDGTNMVYMRRCSKEEHDEIYSRKKADYII